MNTTWISKTLAYLHVSYARSAETVLISIDSCLSIDNARGRAGKTGGPNSTKRPTRLAHIFRSNKSAVSICLSFQDGGRLQDVITKESSKFYLFSNYNFDTIDTEFG